MKNKTMKYLFMLGAVLFLMACKTTEVLKYEYKSTTMIGTRTLTITQDSVVTNFQGRTGNTYTARATSPEEWANLKEASKKVKLAEIANLQSPTNFRSTDAAAYGSIKLTTKDSTYKSSSFDGYDSHADLLPILNLIKEMAQKN